MVQSHQRPAREKHTAPILVPVMESALPGAGRRAGLLLRERVCVCPAPGPDARGQELTGSGATVRGLGTSRCVGGSPEGEQGRPGVGHGQQGPVNKTGDLSRAWGWPVDRDGLQAAPAVSGGA